MNALDDDAPAKASYYARLASVATAAFKTVYNLGLVRAALPATAVNSFPVDCSESLERQNQIKAGTEKATLNSIYWSLASPLIWYAHKMASNWQTVFAVKATRSYQGVSWTSIFGLALDYGDLPGLF